MSLHTDKDWWLFSISSIVRGNKSMSKLSGAADAGHDSRDSHGVLDYHTYLKLHNLLQCQVPSSLIPDERIFIITHQLTELIFKQVIFDLAVVAETFITILSLDDQEFTHLIDENDDFWRPALTASRRVFFSSKQILPLILHYLHDGEAAVFSGIEFYGFRDNLEPASGFQSAQFRLIQQAFGKSNLLSVRLFQADTYRRYYQDPESGPVRVIDELILRDDTKIASPPDDSPLALVAQLDNLAHRVLSRLPGSTEPELGLPAIQKIERSDIDHAVNALHRIAAHRQRKKRAHACNTPFEQLATVEEAVGLFQHDLEDAARRENERRDSLGPAQRGAVYLHCCTPTCHLTEVLSRLAAADVALHGCGTESFLSVHYKIAKDLLRRVKAHAARVSEKEPTEGTGGGGIEYLGFVQRYLLPLFPALAAYTNAGSAIKTR